MVDRIICNAGSEQGNSAVNGGFFIVHHNRRIFLFCVRVNPRLTHKLGESVAKSSVVKHNLDDVGEFHLELSHLVGLVVKPFAMVGTDVDQLFNILAALKLNQLDDGNHSVIGALCTGRRKVNAHDIF